MSVTQQFSLLEQAYRRKPTEVPWYDPKPLREVTKFFTSEIAKATCRVLDVGCGFGQNSMYVAERGHTVEAIDVSPSAISHAQMTLEQANPLLIPHCTFKVKNALQHDLGYHRYGIVLDLGMLHFLPTRSETVVSVDGNGELVNVPTSRERMSYVTRLWRALKPGGYLLSMSFNLESQPWRDINLDPTFRHRHSPLTGLELWYCTLKEVRAFYANRLVDYHCDIISATVVEKRFPGSPGVKHKENFLILRKSLTKVEKQR